MQKDGGKLENINIVKKGISLIGRYFYIIFSCTYLFLSGLGRRKNRDLLHQIYHTLKKETSKKIKPLIPEVKLSDIFEIQQPVKLVEIEGRKGNVNLFELSVLNLFVREFQPNMIFEIGTFDGRTTLNFAINSPPDAKIYTLDLPKNNLITPALPVGEGDNVYIEDKATGKRFKEKREDIFPEKRKIIQLYGDSATFDFTPYYGKMDMIFIDGAHSYEYVLNDSDIAFKLLKNGKGIIIWHDYCVYPGVTRALNEISQKHPELKFKHIKGTSLVFLKLSGKSKKTK